MNSWPQLCRSNTLFFFTFSVYLDTKYILRVQHEWKPQVSCWESERSMYGNYLQLQGTASSWGSCILPLSTLIWGADTGILDGYIYIYIPLFLALDQLSYEWVSGTGREAMYIHYYIHFLIRSIHNACWLHRPCPCDHWDACFWH